MAAKDHENEVLAETFRDLLLSGKVKLVNHGGETYHLQIPEMTLSISEYEADCISIFWRNR